ncbi:SDR family NAD(P)-dependent oxidoreductase [Chitinophaga sp.]|uniref:SDR family NAD(P)-dependent oxidoreductase n=1 Tax=Chitinophaga sp. TaxID=1869181 RepID=UPI0031DE77F2
MGIVLITGATAGFGEACARKFAANGYDLIITGRRQERLAALQQDLEKTNGIQVLPLTFDVQDEKAVSSALEQIPDSWKAVDILINNAGLALGLSTIDEGSLSDWDTMIDTNVKGLLYVSRVVIPWLKARKKGHIINLGSTAAKTVYAKGNVYCATKAAVDAISQGMRIDLLPYFIKVTAIHPGAAETEFSVVRFKGDESKADEVYKGFTPLRAEDIADTIYYCATLPAHVCINDLVITCTQQANAIYTYKE